MRSVSRAGSPRRWRISCAKAGSREFVGRPVTRWSIVGPIRGAWSRGVTRRVQPALRCEYEALELLSPVFDKDDLWLGRRQRPVDGRLGPDHQKPLAVWVQIVVALGGQPVAGRLEQLVNAFTLESPSAEAFYWRTTRGDEVDLLIKQG